MAAPRRTETVKILPGPSARAVVLIPRVFVRVEKGPDRDAQAELCDALVLGRDSRCDLPLSDPSASFHHARLDRGPSQIVVEDLGSTNGTFINSVRVEKGLASAGDRLRVGETVLVLETTSEPCLVTPEPSRSLGGLVGASEQMRLLFGILKRVAPTHLSVLIEGETGTGKELVARTIHELSRRASRPFIVVNTPALVGSLAVSELFGHEKGAFTGAEGLHRGAFERASGGTVFLDEVGELSAEVQAQLLRFLESRTFVRLGGDKPLVADVRIVAATNRDLAAMAGKAGFRSDLFFRLSEFRLRTVPLRDRLGDLPLLVEHLAESLKERLVASGEPPRLGPEAMARLRQHSWPGNVRELRNYLARTFALATEPVICPQDLPPFDEVGVGAPDKPEFPLPRPSPSGGGWGKGKSGGDCRVAGDSTDSPGAAQTVTDLQKVKQLEREIVRQALVRSGGSKAQAARELGIPVTTLKDRLKKLGL
ncbi:MAG: sigma 54-dependent Fis family transcriptional regulator [Candidatus Riflebacteria bacterium]|nr:sigma 54-dependent Fis family transcriptional regulator [Candidatus Riflebacteria bacterium]